MKNLPENELFSAYLDGELTAEEQAQVEQLLSESPDARQLLDELRALGSTLQALPQYTLGKDIHQRVLELAEGKMAADHETSKVADHPPDVAAGLSIRRFSSSRAVFWFATAVAVAVIVMVFNPEVKNERLTTNREEPDIDAAPVVPAINAAPEAAATESDDSLGLGTRPATMDIDSDSLEYESEAGKRLDGASGGRYVYDESAKKPTLMHDAKRPSVTGNLGRKDIVDNRRGRDVGSNASGQTYSLNGAKIGGGSGAIVSNGGLSSSLAAQDKAASMAVIQCAISRQAMNSGALHNALRASGVTLSETYTTQRRLPPTQGKIAKGGYNQTADRGQRGGGDLKVLVVEANTEQIEATLLAMTEQPQTFYSVSVEPARDVEEQEAWRGYVSHGLRRKHAAPPTGSGVAVDAPAHITKREDQFGGDRRSETMKKAIGKLVHNHAEGADGLDEIPAEEPMVQSPAAKTPGSGIGLRPEMRPPKSDEKVAPTTDETQKAPETDGPPGVPEGRESRSQSKAVPSDETPEGDSRQQRDAKPAPEIQPATESESSSPVVEKRDFQRGQPLKEDTEDAPPGEDRARQQRTAGVEEEAVRPAQPTQVDNTERMNQVVGGQLSRPLATYRVLFVVRLVDAGPLSPAASMAIQDKIATERAAKQAAKDAINAKQQPIDANAHKQQ